MDTVLLNLLPGRRGGEVSAVHQPNLTEQNPVNEGNRRQLLQGEMDLELELFLLDQEGHVPHLLLQQRAHPPEPPEPPEPARERQRTRVRTGGSVPPG